MDWPHWFKTFTNWILKKNPFSGSLEEVKAVIIVCILTVMDSPCFTNDWMWGNCNGPKTKMRCCYFRRKNFVGYWKAYPFSNQKRFFLREKDPSKFTLLDNLAFLFASGITYKQKERNRTEVVSVVISGSFKNEDQSEKLIRMLKEQLAHANEQNNALSQKLDQALDQI